MSYYYESKADRRGYHYVNRKVCPFVSLHFHSAVEIIIVKSGRMAAEVGGESFIVGAGEGCFIDSFRTHSYHELEKDTEVFAFVGDCSLFEPIFADVGGVPSAKFKFSDLSFIESLIDHYEKTKSDSLRLAFFKGAMALILTRAAEENTLVSSESRPSHEDFSSVLIYINEHFKEDITLISLSAEFGYSPQYFSRIFHRYMNINLTEYINIARVNYAKKQLSSGKNIADIAFESGFGSMPSFYRAYKKVFGELPRG